MLLNAEDAMSPADISVAANMPRNNVKQLLFKMAKEGEVEKITIGASTVHRDLPVSERNE